MGQWHFLVTCGTLEPYPPAVTRYFILNRGQLGHLHKLYLIRVLHNTQTIFLGGGTGLAKTVKDRFVVAAMGDDNAGTNYGAIYTYTNAIPDFISFDTYNKLSLSGITNPTSKIHALPTGAESTTTYDIGSATNIYIDSAGTYTAEMKGQRRNSR